MVAYVKELNSSFSDKRELYSEYIALTFIRGFDYTKLQYVKEKFPKFPIKLRNQIAGII